MPVTIHLSPKPETHSLWNIEGELKWRLDHVEGLLEKVTGEWAALKDNGIVGFEAYKKLNPIYGPHTSRMYTRGQIAALKEALMLVGLVVENTP